MLLSGSNGRRTKSTEEIVEEARIERASRTSSVGYETTFQSATLMSSFFNLANTIVGSGMLGLPYAYAASGWVLGSFLLVLCGLSSAFALHTLSLCAAKTGTPSSLYSIATHAMPSLTIVIDVANAVNCFGVCTSYLIVIGDLMPDVLSQLGASEAAQDRHLWVFLGFCVVAPLACLRNIDSLSFTSTISIFFVFFLTILIVIYSANIDGLDPCDGINDDDVCKGGTSNAIVDLHTFQVLSIFVFGYTCHQNVFAVTNEMERPTQDRVDKVIWLAIGTAFVIYMIVAGAGYQTYGDEVEPDILVSYPKNYLTSIARLFVSFLVAFSYPLQSHPSRRSILSLLHHWDNYRHGMTDSPAEPVDTKTITSPMQSAGADSSDISMNMTAPPGTTPHPALEQTSGFQLTVDEQRQRYIIVTVCILGISLGIGLTVTNLGTILAFVGATGSTMVSYILPGFYYYILFKEEGPAWKRNLALFQGCLGLLIVPVCVAFIFV